MNEEIPSWAIGQARNLAHEELMALKIFSGNFLELEELNFKANKDYWRKLRFLEEKYLEYILTGKVKTEEEKALERIESKKKGRTLDHEEEALQTQVLELGEEND
jgi:hypothetical protein